MSSSKKTTVPWLEELEPTARLVLKGDKPVAESGRKLKHYEIQLSLGGKIGDVESVTFKLDPTYYDPVRESTSREINFAVDTTTYGDYVVGITAEVNGRAYTTNRRLSTLLKQSHGQAATENEAIARALKDIEEN